MLQGCSVAVPNHIIVERTDAEDLNIIEEYDEYIVINGSVLNKPFVEKPVDADDHNVRLLIFVFCEVNFVLDLHLLPNVCRRWKQTSLSQN